MKAPKRIDLNLDQVDALLKRVESGSLKDSDFGVIKAMAETIHLLSQAVDEKATSIRRLLRMLFGASTEKAKNVLIRQGAQGDVIHNDDTTMKILSLMKENNENESERKGMFTSGKLYGPWPPQVCRRDMELSGRMPACDRNIGPGLQKRQDRQKSKYVTRTTIGVSSS